MTSTAAGPAPIWWPRRCASGLKADQTVLVGDALWEVLAAELDVRSRGFGHPRVGYTSGTTNVSNNEDEPRMGHDRTEWTR